MTNLAGQGTEAEQARSEADAARRPELERGALGVGGAHAPCREEVELLDLQATLERMHVIIVPTLNPDGFAATPSRREDRCAAPTHAKFWRCHSVRLMFWHHGHPPCCPPCRETVSDMHAASSWETSAQCLMFLGSMWV